jgi:hypothetical protein
MEFSRWVEGSFGQKNGDAAVARHQSPFLLRSWSGTSAAGAWSVHD